jgi:dipeptidyl aminopeptidase/acylaminoacyl peptidase
MVGSFVGLNVLAYSHAYAMTHFAGSGARTGEPETLSLGRKLRVLFCGVRISRPRSDAQPNSLGLACRALTMDSDNSIKLGAWYCPAANPGPLVILFHGYASEKTSTLNEAAAFLEMGCSVLLVDFRGSGDSSGNGTTVGYLEADDVAAAVRYARGHLAPTKLILYGQSMGAAAVLRAVACCGVEPDAVIAEAVFDTMLNTVRNRFRAMGVPSFPCAQLLVFWGGRQNGFDAFAHNPVDNAAKVTCPILFLHGAADSRAHIEEARRVFAAVPGRKELKEFPDIGHQASVTRFPNEWRQAVGGFLRDARLEAE